MPEPSPEPALERIKQQADSLSADEQLRLAAYLVERGGMYSHPMLGEDADNRRNQSSDTAL